MIKFKLGRFIKSTSLSEGKLKIRLVALSMILFVIVVCFAFILSGLSVKQIALAITGNYSKTTGQQLTITDWNNLPNDFVARSGGAASGMTGALDMGNNKISNISTTTAANDAATKQYVDAKTAGSSGGGGDSYINWGHTTCPTGDTVLYSGYAFNELYSQSGGGGEPTCIQAGVDPSPVPGPGANGGDYLYPLGTPVAAQVPPGITAMSEVKCAVCYHAGGTCFERYGNSNCNGVTGFTAVYTGYSMGGHYAHPLSINRHCVNNIGFDGSSPNNTWGSVWYGTTIWDNSDASMYATDNYLKCAMCCN